MQHQLKLSPDQFLTYGELQLLPIGKRARVQPSVTALQVARARIPLPQEPLATLCSSYTQQHNLDRNHLARRGIYASLVEQDGEFFFLDPVCFVALLGTVTDLAIPLNLTHAFHQIGNAISVPHALLGILVMLSSITTQSFPIQECIRKCWLSRIHADVTVLVVEGDHVWIRNVVQFVLPLPKPRFHVVTPNVQVTFLDEDFPIEIGWHLNFREFGALLFQLQPHLMMQIRVEHFSAKPMPTDTVLDFLARDKECDLYLGGYHLCSVKWVESLAPSTPSDDREDLRNMTPLPCGIPGLPFGPFDPADLLFTKAIENLENLNCVTSFPGSTFVIVAGTNLWAFTPFDGTESQFATRIRTAFACLVPQDRAVVIPIHKNFRWRTGTRGFIVRDRDQEGFTNAVTVLHETPLPVGTSEFTVVTGSSHRPTCQLHNGFAFDPTLAPADGDVFVLSHQIVRAGGVHDVCKKRLVLLPGATFGERCEFAANTDGWAATDEVWHITSIFNWSTPNIQFLVPVFWDTRINELVPCDGQQFGFHNNTISILPLLIDNHWAGVEVIRLAEVIQVVLVRATGTASTPTSDSCEDLRCQLAWREQIFNLCGWTLLHRWSAMLPIEDWTDPVDLTAIPPAKLQAIHIAIEASQEDWRASGASPVLLRFATQCRTRVLAFLARSTTAVSSAVTMPLSTNVHSIEINPDARAATMSPFSGETPRHLLDYLNRRLEDFRCEPTWAASDEIDFALDVLRPYASHSLFGIRSPLLFVPSQGFKGHSRAVRTLLRLSELDVVGYNAMSLRTARHFSCCLPTHCRKQSIRRPLPMLSADCLPCALAMSPSSPVMPLHQKGLGGFSTAIGFQSRSCLDR